MTPPQPAFGHGGNAERWRCEEVIDPDLLDEESRELWDRAFPDGFWAGGPFEVGGQARLYGFAQACQNLLGFVPQVVAQTIDPELPRMLGEYMENVKAARARGEIEFTPVDRD
jgi:hypothetical protein